MIRSLAAVSTLAAAVVLASAPHAARPSGKQYVEPHGSGALFLFSGHGWGHGVGMGQWGAQGYALQGYTSAQILTAYYPGTTPGTTPETSIRVLLANGKKKLTLSSTGAITVVDANGASHTLAAGQTSLTPALELAVDGSTSPQPLAPPLTFSPAPGSTLTLGRAYRGQVVVDVSNGRLRAIDVLPLEQYLYGVVPAEMPSTWLSAALEAQAVAARSYALASRRAGAPFDVYGDTRSQAYLGVSVETPAATEAVDETAGEVLLYNNQIADTLFSSSTGGWTQSAADAFGSTGLPYLVSQKDPYDTISPYHNWGPVEVTARTLGKALGVKGRILDATVAHNSSRRVKTVNIASLSRGTVRSTSAGGAATQSALGLRSTWFSVGVLTLEPPAPNSAVAPGTRIRLAGVVRGVRNVVVQERTSGEPWKQLRRVVPAAKTGAFHFAVRPVATTDYRLATAHDAAAFVRIRVEPGASNAATVK
jgi:stage II sporulation protein D